MKINSTIAIENLCAYP